MDSEVCTVCRIKEQISCISDGQANFDLALAVLNAFSLFHSVRLCGWCLHSVHRHTSHLVVDGDAAELPAALVHLAVGAGAAAAVVLAQVVRDVLHHASSLLDLVVVSAEAHAALRDPEEQVLVVSLVELLPHAVLQAHVGRHGRVLAPAVAEQRVHCQINRYNINTETLSRYLHRYLDIYADCRYLHEESSTQTVPV